MILKISPNNSKIGKIPNLSLTPGASCVPYVPCFKEGCYAYNSYRRFPNVRAAWDNNLRMYKTERMKFFYDLNWYLEHYVPERFRLFVGGDFPDWEFFRDFNVTAGLHPDTQFLAFTKRYEYNFDQKVENFSVVLSTWPGKNLPTNTELPWSWLEEDDRKPEVYFHCPGGCDDCGHECWDTTNHIVFSKH